MVIGTRCMDKPGTLCYRGVSDGDIVLSDALLMILLVQAVAKQIAKVLMTVILTPVIDM